MLLKLLIALVAAALPGWVFSQQLQSELAGTAGDSFQAGTSALTWTLGEPVTESFGSGATLAQGFLQTLDTATPVYERKGLLFRLDLYPNPVSRFLTLETDSPLPLNIDLYDLIGRRLRTATLNEPILQIDLEGLPAGTYLLRASDGAGTVGAFRVVKTSN